MNNMLVSGKNSRKGTTSQHVQTGTMKYEIWDWTCKNWLRNGKQREMEP
jgi:hypothetical protein